MIKSIMPGACSAIPVSQPKKPDPISAAFPRAGLSRSPMAIFRFSAWFFSICILLSVVAYRFPASSASAVFLLHAVVERFSALVKRSPEFASRSMVSRSRTSSTPRSCKVNMALWPPFPSPWKKAAIVAAASSEKAR